MSYYEDRIKHLEGLVATMAREQRMKAIPVEAKLVERIAEYEAENTRLKAEVDALKLGSLLTAVDVLQFINLKAEVERLRASSFLTAVPVEEYEKLKADFHQASDERADYAKDVSKLKAEVERLEQQVKYWRIEAETDHARWLRVLEDVERLRKAGDYMADHLAHEFGTCPSIEVWNAAKEGKQP